MAHWKGVACDFGHRTLLGACHAMSALGQKQTCAAQKVMSALPPKADMRGATRDVRFVPIADIVSLFDYFIGDGNHARRNGDAKCLGGC